MKEVTRNCIQILDQIRNISNLMPYPEYENLIQMLISSDAEIRIVAEEIVKSLTDISDIELFGGRGFFNTEDINKLLWKN